MELSRSSSARDPKGGPLSVLLRPPIVFFHAILLGSVLNFVWPLRFLPSTVVWLGPVVSLCAVLLFLFSVQEFRAAGTPVRAPSAQSRSSEPDLIDSVAIQSICLLSFSCSDCPFG